MVVMDKTRHPDQYEIALMNSLRSMVNPHYLSCLRNIPGMKPSDGAVQMNF